MKYPTAGQTSLGPPNPLGPWGVDEAGHGAAPVLVVVEPETLYSPPAVLRAGGSVQQQSNPGVMAWFYEGVRDL